MCDIHSLQRLRLHDEIQMMHTNSLAPPLQDGIGGAGVKHNLIQVIPHDYSVVYIVLRLRTFEENLSLVSLNIERIQQEQHNMLHRSLSSSFAYIGKDPVQP